MTSTPGHRAQLAALLNDTQVFSTLKHFLDGVSDEISRIDFTLLPQLNGAPIPEQLDSLISAFDSASDLVTARAARPPEILTAFARAIRSVIDLPAWVQLLNTWPPSFPHSPQLHAVVYFLISLIQKTANPHAVIRWLGKNVPDPEWYRELPVSSNLKAFCVCHLVGKKKEQHWATLDRENHLELYRFGESDLEPAVSVALKEVARTKNGRGLRITTNDGEVFGEIEPVDESQVEVWVQAVQSAEVVPIPCAIFFCNRLVPDSFYNGFYQSLISDDLLLLRTFTHFSVCRIQEGVPLVRALLDIFSYAGKVNALLATLCAADFDSDGLQVTGVLRTNSHLTNMCKVFASKFGVAYFHEVTLKIIDYILQAGDLKLRTVDQCDCAKVQQMVISAINTILKSAPLLPPQLRHLGSVLKAVTALRFNKRQAVYNTLAGFFYLRFLTGAMMDATLFDGYTPPPANIQATVLIPFAQLLQTPLNFNVYTAKSEVFENWNHHFIKHVFPSLITFTWELAEVEEIPDYPAPDQATVQRAIGMLLDKMIQNRAVFEERYRQVLKGTEPGAPINWNLGALLMSFFREEK
jgi:hypothetical protein